MIIVPGSQGALDLAARMLINAGDPVWKGHNRRLRERLQGSTDWEEFESTVVDRKVLGEMGNLDEVTLNRETGRVEGMTLRLLSPNHKNGASIGHPVQLESSKRPCLVNLRMGAASFMRTKFTRSSMCIAASFGQRSPKIPAAGNRPFHQMVEKPGRSTGLWRSPGWNS